MASERARVVLNDQLNILKKSISHKIPAINSVATDTCRTMRSLWEELHQYERFKYTFFIPCDSHGLQLLIKDIISLHPFDKTMKDVNSILTHFCGANKQLALLATISKRPMARSMLLPLPVRLDGELSIMFLHILSILKMP